MGAATNRGQAHRHHKLIHEFAGRHSSSARVTTAGAKFIGFEQGGHIWVGHDDEVMAEVVKLLAPLAGP